MKKAYKEAATRVAQYHPITVGGYGVWCGNVFPETCKTYWDGFDPNTKCDMEKYGKPKETLTEHLLRNLIEELEK